MSETSYQLGQGLWSEAVDYDDLEEWLSNPLHDLSKKHNLKEVQRGWESMEKSYLEYLEATNDSYLKSEDIF